MSDEITEESVQPLEHRILVRRALKPEMTSGGIILPEQARTISQVGVVAKVAPEVKSVVPGDVIVFSTYAASPCVATKEQDLVFVRDRDVLAVVT